MFRIVAGDFHSLSTYNSSKILGEKKLIAAITDEGKPRTEEINLKGNIEKIEVVTEENKKNFFGSAGWGLAGAAALGVLGLIAGALAGGNSKEICFVCYLKDGRKFMALADADTYKDIVAAQFEKYTSPPKANLKLVAKLWAFIAAMLFIIYKFIS